MATDEFRFQILPLREYTLVGLHHRPRYSPLKAILLELSDKIIEDQSVGTFRTVLWQHSDKQEVDDRCLVPFEDLQQVPPAEGEQPPIARLLQSPGKRREGDAETYQTVVVGTINDTRHQIQVGYLDVVTHQQVYLFVSKRTETVKVFIGSVEQIEYLVGLSFLQQLMTGEFMNTEVIAPAYHLCHLGKLLRHHIRHLHLCLHPVIGFLERSQLLDVLRVVGIVIVDIHRRQFVEAFNKHADDPRIPDVVKDMEAEQKEALLGEYLGRAYFAVCDHPRFVIREILENYLEERRFVENYYRIKNAELNKLRFGTE